MSSIKLRYDRSDKQIDLRWTLDKISDKHPIILVADNTLKAHKRIVLDPGTTSYTVEMDAYFTAHQDRANEFVVIGTKLKDNGQPEEGVLITSNQISVAMIEIPTPKYKLVPLDRAFLVDFDHNLNSQGTEDGQFHDQLGKQTPAHTTYDTRRRITQVVVSVTTINPLAMWQAVYNVSAISDNEIKVGLGGLTPAATSKADLVSAGLINHQKYEVNVSYVSDEPQSTNANDANANAEGSLGAGAEGTTEAQYVVPSKRLSAPKTLTIVETPDDNDTVDIYWKAPVNDFGQEANTYLTTVTKYQVFVNSADKTPNFLATPDDNWTQVGSDIAMQADSTKTEVYSLLKQAQSAGVTKYYTVRAVRSVNTDSDTADADRDGTADNVSYGEFHTPVEFTNFVHTNLAAPALSEFSAVVGEKKITFKASSPSNATTTVLTATGYTAQKLVVKMKGTDGANNAHTAEQTYNLQVNQQIYASGVTQTINQLSNGDSLTYGITYQITSAIYEQPGLKIKLGAKANDGSSQQTLGTDAVTYKSAETTPAAITGRTLFTTPGKPGSPASTALNTDNTPLSTATDGRLKLSWSKLAAYDKVGEANSKFFNTIRYRVSGAGSNNPLTTLEPGNDNAGSSPVENKTSSPLTVQNLTVGTKYAALKIQAYFYNTEMGVWVMGHETSAIDKGNVPFYYPDAVTALAYNSNKNGVTWKNPAKDNGVILSDEVTFYYQVGLITNNANPSAAADNAFNNITWQEAATGGADNSAAQSTALGSSYAVRIIPGYRTSQAQTSGLAARSEFAYLARPANPSVTLVAGDKEINATFATNNNDASMVFKEFLQARDSGTLETNGKTTTKAYTGLDNGTRYNIKVQTVYTYPAAGITGSDDFKSAIVPSTDDLNEIPFGKPIFGSSNPVTVSNDPKPGIVTVAGMKNNGRKLREMLVVGIPVDANAVQQEIVIKRFDNDDKTSAIPAVDAGGDNNDVRTLQTVDFGKNLKQAFVVLENEAGSTASLSAST